MSSAPPRILYCHCRYAQVVPPAVKEAVLRHLCTSNAPFDAVPDLCELSARRDPELLRLSNAGPVRIAACFPRAVKWLFANAGAPLPADTTEVLNMRTGSADAIAARLEAPDLQPNLPADKTPPPPSAATPTPTPTP